MKQCFKIKKLKQNIKTLILSEYFLKFNIKPAVQQRIKVVDEQKTKAFGQPSSGAGIETAG
jgi:hypothetical protein